MILKNSVKISEYCSSQLSLLSFFKKILCCLLLDCLLFLFFEQRKVYCRAKWGEQVAHAQNPKLPSAFGGEIFNRQIFWWGLCPYFCLRDIAGLNSENRFPALHWLLESPQPLFGFLLASARWCAFCVCLDGNSSVMSFHCLLLFFSFNPTYSPNLILTHFSTCLPDTLNPFS